MTESILVPITQAMHDAGLDYLGHSKPAGVHACVTVLDNTTPSTMVPTYWQRDEHGTWQCLNPLEEVGP